MKKKRQQPRFKVGDIITAYHKGYWHVTEVEKRRGNAPLLTYRKLLHSNGKECKKRIEKCCDASYCEILTKETIDKKFKVMRELHDNLVRIATATTS